MIIEKQNEIKKVQNNINLHDVEYTVIYTRAICQQKMLIKNKVTYSVNGTNRGKIPVEGKSFLSNVGLLLSGREKILKNFKSNILPLNSQDKIPTPETTLDLTTEPLPEQTIFDTPQPKKEQTKKSQLKLCQNTVNKIESGEKNINNVIFWV